MSERGDKLGCLAMIAIPIVGSVGIVAGLDKFVSEPNRQTADRRTQEVIQGISESYDIVDLRIVPGFQLNGNIGGGFVVFSGQVDGETKTILQFAWKTREQTPKTIISEVPMDKVIFIVTENPNDYTGPKIKFTFDRNKVYNVAYKNPIDTSNPNNIIGGDFLKTIEFDMSQVDFDSFRGDISSNK